MKIHKHWTVTTIAVAVLAAFALAAPPPALAVEPDVGVVAISEVQKDVGAFDPVTLAQEGLALQDIAAVAFVAIHQETVTVSAGTITTSLTVIGTKEACVTMDTATSASPPLYAIPVAQDGTVELAEQVHGDVPSDVEMNC